MYNKPKGHLCTGHDTKTHDMPVISILRKYKNIHQCAAAA